MPQTTNLEIFVNDNINIFFISFYNAKRNTVLWDVYNILGNFEDDYEEALEKWQYENDAEGRKIKIRRIIK